MAKGKVSEQELSTGINLAGLRSLSQAKRDNPFRSTFEPEETPVKPKPTQLAVKTPVESKPLASKEPSPVAKPVVVKEPTKKLASKIVVEPTALPNDNNQVSFERYNLSLPAAMKDELDLLARKLQRRKQNKDYRITGNSVIRCLLRILSERFELRESDVVNSEEELLKLLEKRLMGE